jgi:diacylglycerol kinase
LKKLIKGFGYAFRGIWQGIRTERNLRIHICAVIFVFSISPFYHFSHIDYAVLTLICGAVISAELLNSVIERICDKVSPEKSEFAKQVKDISAAAVLVLSIAAAVAGVFFFWDMDAFSRIAFYFTESPIRLLFPIIFVVASNLFVFMIRNQDKP